MKENITADYFYNNYKKETIELLKIPLNVMTKYNNELVPYEYTPGKRLFRNRRLDSSVNEMLKKNPRLLKFCIENNIKRKYLNVFKGGNLVGYIKMKEKFSNSATN